ncbi:MAG: hypothetical protein KJ600_03445 [Nanoarchaeota archaeon]|nr:hypothetical protein [Nanoarchaeota archaeon]MBU1103582.1 hypothetical protein [Nanoarchaeota archaeon]
MRKEVVGIVLIILFVAVFAGLEYFVGEEDVGLGPSSEQYDQAYIFSSNLLMYWESLSYLTVPDKGVVKTEVYGAFEKSEIVLLDFDEPVSSVTFSGDGEIFSPAGYARVLAVDELGRKHLIFGSDSLVLGEDFEVLSICEETCNFDGKKIKSIAVEIKDALLRIDSIEVLPLSSKSSQDLLPNEVYLDNQENLKVEAWQEKVARENLRWMPDKTSVSGFTYEEKRKLLGGNGQIPDELPNLQGFEYYKGGIFEVSPSRTKPKMQEEITREVPKTHQELPEQEPEIIAEEQEIDKEENEQSSSGKVLFSPSELPESWDWRNVHGENWNTPVKNQGSCGSCWAFAAVGATELLTNLYFNQHIDLDLSEQDVLSCSGGGSCDGGQPGYALDYIKSQGVVDENCFPYSASDESCVNKCADPDEKMKIAAKEEFNSMVQNEEFLKTRIIKGSVSGGIWDWWHAMALIGYNDSQGEDIWIFKNSWGDNWGEEGYGEIMIPFEDFEWTYSLFDPAISDLVPRIVTCENNDGDGYCNWGISPTKPDNCPPGCNDFIGDCNDNDPSEYMANGFRCGTTECNDGIDNDGDGLIDLGDPSCDSAEDNSETFPFNMIDCIDTDGGRDYYEKSLVRGVASFSDGDYYVDREEKCSFWGDLQEWRCNGQGDLLYELYGCPLACLDGACVKCQDSDTTLEYPDGINPYLKGTVELENRANATDRCIINGTVLIEYRCNGDVYTHTRFSCPCSDGVCLIEICTPEEFDQIRDFPERSYVQVCDIDLSDLENFEPIENFYGTYDGNGHKISNFVYQTTKDKVGLFGEIDGGVIKNLTLINITLKGDDFVGGLAGSIKGESVVNKVSIEDARVEGNIRIGGLVGHAAYSQITQSSSTGLVIGEYYVGGLVGDSWNLTTENSYSHTQVSALSYCSGGLIGDDYRGKIINSYSSGLVSCLDCDGLIGGLVGCCSLGETIFSYWDVNSSGQTESPYGSGEGRTTEEMTSVPRPADTYVGWDFENVWYQEDGHYPSLHKIESSPKICPLNWQYFPQIDKCVFNGYEMNLTYGQAVSYCESEDGWLANSLELNSVCDSFHLRPGEVCEGYPGHYYGCIGFVRVTEHKLWHDTGFHFVHPVCDEVVYDSCGTQAMNGSNCQLQEFLVSDDDDYGFVCLKEPIMSCEPQHQCRSDGCGQDYVPEGDAWCEQEYGSEYQCCVRTMPLTCSELGGVCMLPDDCNVILASGDECADEGYPGYLCCEKDMVEDNGSVSREAPQREPVPEQRAGGFIEKEKMELSPEGEGFWDWLKGLFG